MMSLPPPLRRPSRLWFCALTLGFVCPFFHAKQAAAAVVATSTMVSRKPCFERGLAGGWLPGCTRDMPAAPRLLEDLVPGAVVRLYLDDLLLPPPLTLSLLPLAAPGMPSFSLLLSLSARPTLSALALLTVAELGLVLLVPLVVPDVFTCVPLADRSGVWR